MDSKKLTFVRSGPQGFEEVKLEAGDSGFCIARLGDKIVETEVPRLLLAPLAPVLRPAACKRPAAAMAEDKAEVEDNNLDEDDGDDKSDPSEEMQEEPPSHEMEEEPPSHGDGKPADVPPEPIVRKYRKVYHKHEHAYRIRRKFLGNYQAFQFGGTACKLSPAQLSTIADETIRKMEEEDLEEGLALTWAKEEMKRVSLTSSSISRASHIGLVVAQQSQPHCLCLQLALDCTCSLLLIAHRSGMQSSGLFLNVCSLLLMPHTS